MTEQQRPEIVLDHTRIMCPIHGEPFRERWPEGYLKFGLTLFQAHMEDPEVQTVSGGDIEKAAKMLDGRPLCCRFDVETVVAAYMASGVGRSGVCQGCRKVAMGTRFLTSSKSYSHLCFRCVAGAKAQWPTTGD